MICFGSELSRNDQSVMRRQKVVRRGYLQHKVGSVICVSRPRYARSTGVVAVADLQVAGTATLPRLFTYSTRPRVEHRGRMRFRGRVEGLVVWMTAAG